MKSEAMFRFELAETTPLPIWLSQQAVAAAPATAERERLLREDDKEKNKKCHRRVRTLALIVTLVFTIALLVALIMLVVQAMTTVTSAKDNVGAKVALLWNATQAMTSDTRMAINSLRGASRNAELFTVHSFEHLNNASAHVHDLSEFIERAAHDPLSMKLVG